MFAVGNRGVHIDSLFSSIRRLFKRGRLFLQTSAGLRIEYGTVLLFLLVASMRVDAQEIWIPASAASGRDTLGFDCDNRIYQAREMYNRGKLSEVLVHLTPCANNTDLILRQRRALYRLLAESHLFLRAYPEASEYARRLAEIDPKLQVYGISRLPTAGRKDLRTAIQSSRYVDAPDLLLLVGNIRYRALGLEVFGGLSKEFFSVKEIRTAPGVTEITDQEWSRARRNAFGVGLKYDPYHFPLSVSLRLNLANVSFTFQSHQVIDGAQLVLTYVEKQNWLAPELWFGYQFAPKTFPIKNMDFSLRAGAGADILTGSILEDATLARMQEIEWYGGQERDIHDLIEQKIYPVALAAFALDYRFGRQSVFAELQYRHPFLDKYIYDLPLASYASSVRSVHGIGLQVGVRWVFYRAFYK